MLLKSTACLPDREGAAGLEEDRGFDLFYDFLFAIGENLVEKTVVGFQNTQPGGKCSGAGGGKCLACEQRKLLFQKLDFFFRHRISINGNSDFPSRFRGRVGRNLRFLAGSLESTTSRRWCECVRSGQAGDNVPRR